MDTLTTIEAWTSYWRTGRGASCLHGADIEVSLDKTWNELIDDFPNGARLLDLATGNGAAARLCAARARFRNIHLKIDAVDAAAIDPPKVVADPTGLLADINFHGGVHLEALPFAGASFDGIVSQFGFEYADEDLAVAEVARVAAPGARLRFVMHASDGAVSRDIGLRLERLRAVLSDRGPVTLIRTLARALDTGDAATIARESAHLPRALELTRLLAKDPPSDDAALFYASEFLHSWSLRKRYRASDLRRSIEEGWQNADGVATRQSEMLRVARTREGIATLSKKFAASGFVVAEARELREGGRGVQIAWLFTARRQRPG